MNEQEFLAFLHEQGYEYPHILPNGRWAALHPFFFTVAVVTGEVGDTTGYSDRWCYNSRITARVGLLLWVADGGAGEPVGWHRHPKSGRRIARTEGEVDDKGNEVPIGQEYVRR